MDPIVSTWQSGSLSTSHVVGQSWPEWMDAHLDALALVFPGGVDPITTCWTYDDNGTPKEKCVVTEKQPGETLSEWFARHRRRVWAEALKCPPIIQ